MAQRKIDGPVVTSSQTTADPIPSNGAAQIDLLVSLHLHFWPALTLAIQNGWGGSPQASSDKRDWMAGAVSELLTSSPPQLADASDLEEVLVQVMLDEFEVVVDDGSAGEVAGEVLRGVGTLRKGEVRELQTLYERWQQKQSRGAEKINAVRGEDKDGDDTDWDDDDDSGEEWNGFGDASDVDMSDAPALVEGKLKQKVEPEIDEDGFTKVMGKKKR